MSNTVFRAAKPMILGSDDFRVQDTTNCYVNISCQGGPTRTGSDVKVRARKNVHDKSDRPENNHDCENSPPISNHLRHPPYENSKEEEKTEFNREDCGMCEDQIRRARFVKLMRQKI